jgi:hypothetical protein
VDAGTLAARWAGIESAVEEHARFPPGALSVSIWQDIAAGKVARPRRADGAVGVGLLACSRAEAWLAVTDDHPVDTVKGLTQVALAGAWAGEKWLYQLIDLPWPVTDRHWVLHSTNNVALATSTGVWERVWTLADDWLPRARPLVDPARFDAAVQVPRNEGSWLLVDLDATHTLGIYQAHAALGGAVPAEAAEAYTASTLDSLFATTTRDAVSMRSRYAAPCVTQPGGDGRPIPCFVAP